MQGGRFKFPLTMQEIAIEYYHTYFLEQFYMTQDVDSQKLQKVYEGYHKSTFSSFENEVFSASK